MPSNYYKYAFKVEPPQPGVEILLAQLSEFPFESFEESETGLDAYIPIDQTPGDLKEQIETLDFGDFSFILQVEEIETINWNEAWEKQFEPIEVDGRCAVRAPFHEPMAVEYEIVIEPKMSFGTGHHETTHLMIKQLLKADLNKKKVLDMGSGTGILAILAAMKGAKEVDAIDIDHWCYMNALENVERNQVSHIRIEEGDVGLLSGRSYEVIIANINRNVLLNDIPAYAKCLPDGGTLFLSGFYTEDIPLISERCNEHGLHFSMNYERNNWVACKFIKQ
ncbi:50S ribosomal protein L11 methyltransferase [Croceiramulus getboli]|nr:50S ribosomal protein L11 methyltransferase [Flavobacteriaceae bacterium YJPT1-3]